MIICYSFQVIGQEDTIIGENHALFDGMVLNQEDEGMAVELKERLDLWLEKPVCINSDDAGQLADFGLISLYQYNKLKEYRLKYGDFVSVFELKNIDGWSLDLAQKVAPYVTADGKADPASLSFPEIRKTRQELVLRVSFNPELRKGYDEMENGKSVQRQYLGSPLRLSMRYDMDVAGRVEFGLRMEKDQGEPYLTANKGSGVENFGPDHSSVYLKFNFRGMIKTVILGDYRMSFGYGLNYSGGSISLGSTEGLPYPAQRLRANTSMSESGYLRGASAYVQRGHFGLTGFFSNCNLDGNSIVYDSLGVKPVSFSSLDYSGLHRTTSEISQSNIISETIYGGHLVFMNNWLKAGLISYYSTFSIPMQQHTEPYALFRFSGRSNLVTGLTFAVWLRRIRVASELSFSRNKAFAFVAGAEFIPINGITFTLSCRHFDRDYQNLHGSGFSGSNNNDNETGMQLAMRLETPWRWLLTITADAVETHWVSYRINAPSRRWLATIAAERAWRNRGGIYFSFRYKKATAVIPDGFSQISHPEYSSFTDLRLEGRYSANQRLLFKSRVETNAFSLSRDRNKGWLVLQDIGYTIYRIPLHAWLRVCFFESQDYSTRLYAIESDVLYDFGSFMYDGKGMRTVFLLKYSPWRWLDLWFRISSVSYRDRPAIGSGWDEVKGNHLEEIDLQLRLRM